MFQGVMNGIKGAAFVQKGRDEDTFEEYTWVRAFSFAILRTS